MNAAWQRWGATATDSVLENPSHREISRVLLLTRMREHSCRRPLLLYYILYLSVILSIKQGVDITVKITSRISLKSNPSFRLLNCGRLFIILRRSARRSRLLSGRLRWGMGERVTALFRCSLHIDFLTTIQQERSQKRVKI